jgi:hypothetical protein
MTMQATGHSEELEAARSIIPYFGGDAAEAKKGEYLSCRFVGFSVKEALALSDSSMRTLNRWRQGDQIFLDAEQQVSGPNRGQLRKEIHQILFSRNMFLVWRHDYEILAKANHIWEGELKITHPDGTVTSEIGIVPMTKDDREYLVKLRGQYNPSQLESIEKLLQNQGEGFNINNFIMNIQQNLGVSNDQGQGWASISVRDEEREASENSESESGRKTESPQSPVSKVSD